MTNRGVVLRKKGVEQMSLDATGTEIIRPHDVPPRRVQVFGERSSGTNFVKRLIGRNTALVPTEDYGWKHGFPQMTGIGRDTLIVGVVRAVEPWLLSMYAKPWHCPPAMQALDFPGFIRAEWATVIDRARYFPGAEAADSVGTPLLQDRDPLSGTPFANILKLRAAKAAALLGYRNRACNLVLARLEVVQADPEGFIGALTGAFSLPPVAEFRPVVKRLGAKFKHAVDNRPPPPREICAADRAFVASELDAGIETALGYRF